MAVFGRCDRYEALRISHGRSVDPTGAIGTGGVYRSSVGYYERPVAPVHVQKLSAQGSQRGAPARRPLKTPSTQFPAVARSTRGGMQAAPECGVRGHYCGLYRWLPASRPTALASAHARIPLCVGRVATERFLGGSMSTLASVGSRTRENHGRDTRTTNFGQNWLIHYLRERFNRTYTWWRARDARHA